eukprot:scaffold46870_cov33-Tisochrysis_lutea.AAC.1
MTWQCPRKRKFCRNRDCALPRARYHRWQRPRKPRPRHQAPPRVPKRRVSESQLQPIYSDGTRRRKHTNVHVPAHA